MNSKMRFNPQTGKFHASGTVEKSLSAYRQFVTEGDLGTHRLGQLRSPYRNSVWVMSAIAHCFNPIKTVPLNLTIDDEPVEDDVILRFLDHPMMSTGGKMKFGALVEASIVWKKLKGEFFWVLDDSWLDPRIPLQNKGLPMVVRPDEMREVCDHDNGDLIGWSYTPRSGKRTQELLLPEQVIHNKRFDPDNDIRGLAAWESAALAAESDFAAGTFAKNLMDSNGDRGPIVTGDGSISDEQYEQVSRALREKMDRNRRGEYRPLFLVGSGLKVEDPKAQSIDSDFVAQRLGNRHEIYIAFGVPPSFAEVTASYSIGSASDKLVNIENNAEPESCDISDAIEELFNGSGTRQPIRELNGKLLVAYFDWDEHPAKQQVRAERIEAAIKLVDRGVPWREASEYFNLRLGEFEGDGIGRIPANLVDISRDPAQAREKFLSALPLPKLGKLPASDALETITKAFAARTVTKMEGMNNERAELWEKIHAARKPWEKKFKSRFTRLLFEARKQTLARIDAVPVTKGIVTKAASVELAFDLPDWLTEFLQGMTAISREAMNSARRELWLDELLRDDDPGDLVEELVLETLRERENKLSETADDIHQQILATLEQGLNEGETMDELSARVKTAFNGINDVRAEAIATTETTIAYEVARQQSMKDAGVEFKEWVTSQDDRVRLDNFHVDGNIVGIDDTHTVGSEEMMHPGDPAASASQVIRCRCVEIASIGPATPKES